jgi:hypothetical protein
VKISETVLRQLDAHVATVALEWSQINDRLETLPSLSALGRRLRHRRDQLRVQMDAWEYLSGRAQVASMRHETRTRDDKE